MEPKIKIILLFSILCLFISTIQIDRKVCKVKLLSFPKSFTLCSSFQKNELIFVAFKCTRGNSTIVLLKDCIMKKAGSIGTDRLDMIFKTIVVKPLRGLNVHVEMFYRYLVYKKFPIDIWEDICADFSGKKSSNYMNLFFKRFFNAIKYDGGKLECPIYGNVSATLRNISLNEYFPSIPILPSGRYRADFTFTEGRRNSILVYTQLFFAISDNRIEQY